MNPKEFLKRYHHAWDVLIPMVELMVILGSDGRALAAIAAGLSCQKAKSSPRREASLGKIKARLLRLSELCSMQQNKAKECLTREYISDLVKSEKIPTEPLVSMQRAMQEIAQAFTLTCFQLARMRSFVSLRAAPGTSQEILSHFFWEEVSFALEFNPEGA